MSPDWFECGDSPVVSMIVVSKLLYLTHFSSPASESLYARWGGVGA